MLSFNDFVAYCRTLDGQVLPTAGEKTTFTVSAKSDKVYFIPSGRDPQEPIRPGRTEKVLEKLAKTNDYSTSPYTELSRQASYILGVMARHRDEVASKRLPAELLRKVSALDVWEAIQRLLAGENVEPFIDSTKYDLLTGDGLRLPPKAVFGVALSIALDREILPFHFSGGEDSLCFEMLRRHGYRIVPKGVAAPGPLPGADDSDKEFPEGMEKLWTHKGRERSDDAVIAKKADYLAKHGVLGCERCGEDFTAKYGAASAACIEVHHHKLAMSAMPPGYRTKLDDLQCLCANCHRVVHYELRITAKVALSASVDSSYP